MLVIWQSPALAGDGEGQRNNTSAGASASGGTITVTAGDRSWIPPAGSPWAQRGQGDPPGRRNPDQPYGCTYKVAPVEAEQLLGAGGPSPGQWVFVTCAGPGVINPMPPIWVTDPKAPAAVNPAFLAREAVARLPLATPSIEMAPANHERPVGQREHVAVDRPDRLAPAFGGGNCRPGDGDRHSDTGQGRLEYGRRRQGHLRRSR